ncbi:adenylate/guanylate cyclase domain-containing protein [Polyangium jinanense]|uniref:Adenylate/guanylate cyclase domain-containing protein n=1 Tax=Polyangium jinanense TaxID=2829994 RepID=A0A9X3WYR7_9BACT|nr:adenylate/guanylate cyclase domain-containing protein [Polyangium jinanense]MDC3953454.1 adenylate/guanylate cyclase domain-containing protein [Polyangium jinanense]MDC3979425.1 adenylate/guanylate cyclase domain-containing protein [Polyangium jinanense]
MPSIFYAPDQIRIDVEERQTLLNAALSAGIPHTHVCGGHARCSTCRVIVVEGLDNIEPPNEVERALAERLGLPREVRIACQATVRGSVRVRRLVLDDDDVALVDRMRKSKVDLTPVGEEIRVAILFSDIRGFTPFTEALLPYDVIHVLNRHFEAMGSAVATEGGFINNYMGDGFMALFGVDGKPDAPMRAVRAALGMLSAMTSKMTPYLLATYGHAFDIGIGIHYGEAVVGPVGSSDRKAITAIGDAVNFASRIESATKDIGARLLVSEAIHREITGRAVIGKTARVSVKGKTGEHELFEVTAVREG